MHHQPIYKQSLSGMMMPINDIKPEHIDFEDMAVQLSRIYRYTGASLKNISVARHSLNVAKALWLEHDVPWTTVFYGLLHDGHEYIFGDIISPVKNLIKQLYGSSEKLNRVVDQADRAIFEAAGLDATMTDIQKRLVKMVDLRMLATEKRDWLHQPNMAWHEELPEPYACRYAHTVNEDLDAAEFLQWVKNLQSLIAKDD